MHAAMLVKLHIRSKICENPTNLDENVLVICLRRSICIQLFAPDLHTVIRRQHLRRSRSDIQVYIIIFRSIFHQFALHGHQLQIKVLNPFQNIGHFNFFRFTVFSMYLDIYNKYKPMNLEKSKRPKIWNEGSIKHLHAVFGLNHEIFFTRRRMHA